MKPFLYIYMYITFPTYKLKSLLPFCQSLFSLRSILLCFALLYCNNLFSKMSRHPTVKWAQRSDTIYITIDLPDAKDVNLKLEPEGKFFFSATSGADKIPYEIDIDLFDKVDVNESKASVGLRNIRYLVKKAENKWWSRLLKQEGKPPVFLKVDWDKWVDEDEEPEDKDKLGADMDFGDFDFSKLNMGGGEDLDDDAGDKDEENDDSDTEEEVAAEAAPAGGEAGTKA